jgi:hypothetical protein
VVHEVEYTRAASLRKSARPVTRTEAGEGGGLRLAIFGWRNVGC